LKKLGQAIIESSSSPARLNEAIKVLRIGKHFVNIFTIGNIYIYKYKKKKRNHSNLVVC